MQLSWVGKGRVGRVRLLKPFGRVIKPLSLMKPLVFWVWPGDERLLFKKVNRKVQGVPQSQTAANPRNQKPFFLIPNMTIYGAWP